MRRGAPKVTKTAKSWRIANSTIEVAFTEEGGLIHVRHRPSRHSFRVRPRGAPIWQVELRDAGGETRTIVPEGPCHISHRQNDDQAEMELHWPEGAVAVKAHVSLERESPISHWRIEVENRTQDALWEVVYPRLQGLGKIEGDGEGDRLASPAQYGTLMPNPIDFIARGGAKADWYDIEYSIHDIRIETIPRVAFSYPGYWGMQFFAFYHPERAGIYFGAHDPQANFKRFGLYGQPGGKRVDLVMQNFPEERIQGGLNYHMPYPAVIGVFDGEWWNASAIHRDWAEEQEWCAKGPIRHRKDLPQWVKDTDLWYWNYQYHDQYTPEEVVPAILDLKERTGAEMCIHWYRWNGGMFNALEPFPLEEPWKERLAKGLEELHQAGVRAIPYTNARLWDCTDESYQTQGGPESVALNERGEALPWTIKGPCANYLTMCPYAYPWQKKMEGLMKQVVEEVGMDGAYIDQITSSFVIPCFVESHGHPRGGGNSWYEGYRQMMNLIRATVNTKHPEVIWTSESTIDCWVDQFDANLSQQCGTIDGRYGDGWLPIPLSNSVYHEYGMVYGSGQPMDRVLPDAFYLGYALVLVGGTIPLISGYFAKHVGTDELKDYVEYLVRLVKARKSAHKYLAFGRWLPPVELEVEEVDAQWSEEGKPKRVPAVVTATWKDEEGSVCLALVNHTGQERKIKYSFPGEGYGMTNGGLTLVELTEDGERVLASDLPPTFEREEEIGPRQPKVFVVR